MNREMLAMALAILRVPFYAVNVAEATAEGPACPGGHWLPGPHLWKVLKGPGWRVGDCTPTTSAGSSPSKVKVLLVTPSPPASSRNWQQEGCVGWVGRTGEREQNEGACVLCSPKLPVVGPEQADARRIRCGTWPSQAMGKGWV